MRFFFFFLYSRVYVSGLLKMDQSEHKLRGSASYQTKRYTCASLHKKLLVCICFWIFLNCMCQTTLLWEIVLKTLESCYKYKYFMNFKRCNCKALYLYPTVLLVQYSRNCCKIEEASHADISLRITLNKHCEDWGPSPTSLLSCSLFCGASHKIYSSSKCKHSIVAKPVV